MFTGLVEELGSVRRLERLRDGGRLTVQARTVLEGTRIGDSIAVNGACLTVVDLQRDSFTVDFMAETMERTTIGSFETGTRVNLERSLAVGGRAGGHLVLGHVDAVGEVVAVRATGVATELRFSLPDVVAPCVAPKGSIAIDGISLTVMRVGDGGFEVGIIPHTLKETTLGSVRVGARVNLEADVLARYVLRVLQVQQSQADEGRLGSAGATGGLTEELLREQGFA
jgi:riboflavin synthase